jgi:hypothetical protein
MPTEAERLDELLGLREGKGNKFLPNISSSATDKEWQELYFSNLGDREALRIPKEANIAEKLFAIPVALASIYGKDLIDWIMLPGDVMQGKVNPTAEELTMWSMGAMGGGTSFGEIPVGALGMGGKVSSKRRAEILMTVPEQLKGKPGEAAFLESRRQYIKATAERTKSESPIDELLAEYGVTRTPERAAEQLGLTYQGKWGEEYGNMMEFFDKQTGGNVTIKTLDELEERIMKLRDDMKKKNRAKVIFNPKKES